MATALIVRREDDPCRTNLCWNALNDWAAPRGRQRWWPRNGGTVLVQNPLTYGWAITSIYATALAPLCVEAGGGMPVQTPIQTQKGQPRHAQNPTATIVEGSHQP